MENIKPILNSKSDLNFKHMLIQTPAEHEQYLRKFVLEPPMKILEVGYPLQAVLLMAQSFEIYGAYFDNKPFRAKGQSLKRFELAIRNLFHHEYFVANKNNTLYYQLRTLIVHSFLPGESLIILPNGDVKQHLKLTNGVLTVIPAILGKDVQTAGIILIEKLNNGKVIPKKVTSSLLVKAS